MAADSVWHAWIDVDPVGLDRFCRKHFRQVFEHTPAACMRVPMAHALATTLVKGWALSGQLKAGASLPRLFTLDRRVRMPGGYAYQVAGGLIAYQVIGLDRRPAGDFIYPSSLSGEQLLQAGLVTQAEFDEQVARQKDSGSGGCGSASSSSNGGGEGGGDCG